MKKIEIPQKIYHDDEFDINIKTFLTPEDIKTIGETAFLYDNYIEQKVAIGYSLLRLCTDINVKEIDNLEDVALFQSGLYDKLLRVITNSQEIFEYLEDKKNINMAMVYFVNKTLPSIVPILESLIDKMPDAKDLEQMVQILPQNIDKLLNLKNAENKKDDSVLTI